MGWPSYRGGVGVVVCVETAGNTHNVRINDLGVVGWVVNVAGCLDEVVEGTVLCSRGSGKVDGFATPHVALSEGGECEGRDDAEVVVATFEGFEEEWVGFGGNLEDQTGTCYELKAR